MFAARWRALELRPSPARKGRPIRPAVRDDPLAPALLLSPHLDDVVFSCWTALTGPGEKRVVNVFAGVPPSGFVTKWDRACGAQESAAHVRERIAEDAEVLRRLGCEPHYLPFVDRQYGAPRPTLAEIDAAVGEVVPAARVAYAPAGLGFSHSDHLLVRDYARWLAQQGMPVILYADLPYAVRCGDWPGWVHKGGREGAASDSFWRPALRAVPELAGTEVVRLAPEDAAAKLHAMRAYRSQFPGLDHDGRLSDALIHGRE